MDCCCVETLHASHNLSSNELDLSFCTVSYASHEWHCQVQFYSCHVDLISWDTSSNMSCCNVTFDSENTALWQANPKEDIVILIDPDCMFVRYLRWKIFIAISCSLFGSWLLTIEQSISFFVRDVVSKHCVFTRSELFLYQQLNGHNFFIPVTLHCNNIYINFFVACFHVMKR